MQVSEPINKARNLTGEPNPAQRWPDPVIMDFCDTAQKIIMRDIKWPESRFSFVAGGGAQEYTLQEVLKVLRVYIQGQPIIRTDMDTLEGIQTQFYDQTGQGGGPGPGPIVSGAPSNIVVGQYTPQWTGQAAETYPVASQMSAPGPDAQPWYPGQRPRYYLRGGNIGFVPPVAGTAPVVIDCVRVPPTLTATTQGMVLGYVFEDALAWKIVELAYTSDTGNSNRDALIAKAEKEYMKALGEIRSWKREYSGQGPRGPKPLTQRRFYQKGRNRYYGGCNND